MRGAGLKKRTFLICLSGFIRGKGQKILELESVFPFPKQLLKGKMELSVHVIFPRVGPALKSVSTVTEMSLFSVIIKAIWRGMSEEKFP